MAISISLFSLISSYSSTQETEKVTVKEQISPYRLNKYRKCPKNFQYRQLGLPKQKGDDTALEFGKMLHLIQEMFYDKIPENPTKDKITQIAGLCLEHEWLPRFQSKQRTAKRAVANFILFEQWRLSESKKKNIPYKVVDDEGKLIDPIIETDIYSDLFHAVVDFCWQANQMLLDWKFGKSNTVYESYKIQLSIERHVLEFNEIPVNFAGFGFLRKSPQPVRVATYNVSMLKGFRTALLSAIASNHFPCKEGPLCWYCEDFTRCEAEKKGFHLWNGILR